VPTLAKVVRHRTFVRKKLAVAMPGTRRILLVEDESLIRELLGHVLHAERYAVDVAATVADAWRQFKARRYALVIVDWRLPDGDGFEIADAAASRGQDPRDERLSVSDVGRQGRSAQNPDETDTAKRTHRGSRADNRRLDRRMRRTCLIGSRLRRLTLCGSLPGSLLTGGTKTNPPREAAGWREARHNDPPEDQA
jgi:CheY-like chemotaxis protein